MEEKEVIRQAVEEVLRHAEPLQRGQVLRMEVIEQAAGIDRYTEFWARLIFRLKREMLRRRQIALWDARVIPELRQASISGYLLVTKDQQINMIAEKRQQRARRQLRRARNEVRAIPAEELTTNQRLVQWYRVQQIEGQERTIRDNLRHQEVLRRTPTLPPKPRL